jgi:hypothetical protein
VRNREALEPLAARTIDLEKPIMYTFLIEEIRKGLKVCEKRVCIKGVAIFRIG